MFAPQVAVDALRVLLAQQAGGDALERADHPGQSDLRGIVHEQVDMVRLAVELGQLGPEVAAHLGRDLFAAGEDLVGEGRTPVLGDEDQMGVQGVDDATTPADIRIWFPSW